MIRNKRTTLFLYKQRFLILMTLPGIIWIIIFQYLPLYGIIISFQDYDIIKGFLHSEWIGLDNFKEVFSDIFFIKSLESTLVISILKLIAGFPAPILFALLLNELLHEKFKRIIQSLSYLPYFLSWVFVVGFIYNFFAVDGPVNNILKVLGIIKEPLFFLGNQSSFLLIIIISEVWKGFGWGSIIYLANITSLDTQIYESATIDGAGRFRKAISITLPMLKPTMVILLILSISSLLSSNFDQMFLMSNPLVKEISDVLSVYTYNMGIMSARYSYAASVGLFTSLVSCVLLTLANYVSGKLTDESLF